MFFQDEWAAECGGVVTGGRDDAELRMFGERDVGFGARVLVMGGGCARGQ
ncbi:hypothetical protein [Streptomyces hokutonensis]